MVGIVVKDKMNKTIVVEWKSFSNIPNIIKFIKKNEI
jgi:ribosomal protein S17